MKLVDENISYQRYILVIFCNIYLKIRQLQWKYKIKISCRRLRDFESNAKQQYGLNNSF